jgi:hypothetical protein
MVEKYRDRCKRGRPRVLPAEGCLSYEEKLLPKKARVLATPYNLRLRPTIAGFFAPNHPINIRKNAAMETNFTPLA